jgi:hypothetical protein
MRDRHPVRAAVRRNAANHLLVPALPGRCAHVTEITVEATRTSDGWICRVDLADPDGSRTQHEVLVTRTDLERFASGADDPADLVRRSFEFLLAREPKESILRSFDLPVIGRYFPEYERAIRMSQHLP